MKNINLFFLILVFIFIGCKRCNNSDAKILNDQSINLNEGNAIEQVMGLQTISDTVGSSTQKIVPKGNVSEQQEDKRVAQKILEDIEQSEFSNCFEILIEYNKCLEEFKKGNRKPLKDFPIKSDPKILICQKKNLAFANSLDSLKKIANKLVDDYIESLEK